MGSRRKKRLSSEGKRNPCVVCQQPTITKPLRSAQDVLACLKPFRDKKVEYFVTLSLDGAGRLIRRRVVTIGLLSVSLAHPREVFAGPLMDRAASVILSHNHPSSVAEPSKEDIKTTQQLIAAGILLGIPVDDHYIICKTGYFSFREQGLIGI
jgi:DNA repair protein RadC